MKVYNLHKLYLNMHAPTIISTLVERFRDNIESYRSGKYNETQLRREFLDPLFTALGWDVDNKQGHAEAYKDVIHEDAIKVGGATKAPDYCFRIGGVRKFFVEAKKPSVNVKDELTPAYQLRRYAWSANLPLSILTDFEELAIYDCRTRPVLTDKPSTGRILYLTYTDYVNKWGEIQNVFSKEAVLKGSFDKYAESTKGKKGTAAVDDAFLSEIESWRSELARIIAIRNPILSQRELNFSVQRTIDRLIFLRICEDRGIEEYGRLQTLLNGERTYKRLTELFHRADERYNSGLFHFSSEKDRNEAPDELTLNLAIDDKPLKDIVRRFYYPESPYEFSVLPADILGQVYEQFLGKIIRLTPGHQAKIEDKPEIKKAGGVFYTPTYIVEYIVKNTVAGWLKGKTPKQASKLRILDPACGSGSFLIYAYQYLLDWHRDWYVEHEQEKAGTRNSPIRKGISGEWRLTTNERKRILLNSIFGVDIDSQAVEVTKLSLLLKVLEGETDQTLTNQLRLFHERALPDLGNNIKCGNSLIGPDFYAGTQLSLLDDEERLKINVFNWFVEFAEIMDGGGFDIVIGNPPWGADFKVEEKEYLKAKYKDVHIRTPESFNYFIKKMWDCANRDGMIGLIIPSSFLNQHEFWKTRKMLVESELINRICNLGDAVFHKVSAPSSILVFSKIAKDIKKIYLDLRKFDRKDLILLLKEERCSKDASKIGKDSESFQLQINLNNAIIKKCYYWPKLREVSEDVATGISSGLDKAYVYNSKQVSDFKLEKELLKKLMIGGEINRYSFNPKSKKQIIYITPEINLDNYPNCRNILQPFREVLMKRREAANGKIPWFSLNWPRRRKLFDNPKILIRQTSDRILATYDTEGWYCLKSIIIVQLKEQIKISYEYLLAILNSRLIDYLYNDLVGEKARVFPEVKPVQLFKLPVRPINFNDQIDKSKHDFIVNNVVSILDLNKKLVNAKIEQEQITLKRQIDALDEQIDKKVYELYGLTEEEIKIVEGVAG
ncbi:MAG: Eco57I restriction-modification methylase domain-containing protein [Bacteroidota bacterium]